MATTVTAAELIAVLDVLQDMFLPAGDIIKSSNAARLPAVVYGNGSPTAGTGDGVFIGAFLAYLNGNAATPIYTTAPKSDVAGGFSCLQNWAASAGLGSTLDGALTSYNGSPGAWTQNAAASPTTAYQYSLTGNKALLSPSNVFAPATQFSTGVVGSGTALTLTPFSAISSANNGAIGVAIIGASAGTYQLAINIAGNVQTTSALAYNASAATVQAAIVALSNVGTGNAIVIGTASAYTIYIMVPNASVTAVIATTASFNTGASVAVYLAAFTQYVLNLGGASGGTFTASILGQTTSGIAYGVSASTLQSDLLALTTAPAGSISVSGSAGAFVVTVNGFNGAPVPGLAQGPLTVNGASLTGGSAAATCQASVYGGGQGYTPAAGAEVVVTENINGTCAATFVASGWNSAGTWVTGRNWTATLDNLNAGQTAALTPANSGDRIAALTGASKTGTSTAGNIAVISSLDRAVS
jgi:hypothetical protein